MQKATLLVLMMAASLLTVSHTAQAEFDFTVTVNGSAVESWLAVDTVEEDSIACYRERLFPSRTDYALNVAVRSSSNTTATATLYSGH